jgi:hypothetical protein
MVLLVARKQGRGAEKASAGGESHAKIRCGFRKGRRAIRRLAGRPYKRITRLLREEWVSCQV